MFDCAWLRATILGLAAVLVGPAAAAQTITLPPDFFAERIQGGACAKFFSPGRLDSDLKQIAGIRNVRLKSDNSLTINHDALSARWTRLLGVSYGAAARGDAGAARRIIGSLVDLAASNALLDAPSYNSAKQSRCWDGGNSGSPCPLHVVAHTGYTAVAMLYSAIVLEEYITPGQRPVLDAYFDKVYRKFISPLASDGAQSAGLYEFGDYGLGVLAYARWTGDTGLAKSELRKRRNAFARKIDNQGMLKENAFRGYRGYWYHTLGAESALGYALVARSFGHDFFKDPKIGPKLQNLAIQSVNGGRNYAEFRARALSKSPQNAIRDPAAEIPHMHQFAVNLPTIIAREYGYRVSTAAGYASKGRGETISKLTGFNADCYYASQR